MHRHLVFQSAITNVPSSVTDTANIESDVQANVHLIATMVSHREVSSKSRNYVPHNLTYSKSLPASLTCMKSAHLNPRSGVNKADAIQNCIIDHGWDVLALL